MGILFCASSAKSMRKGGGWPGCNCGQNSRKNSQPVIPIQNRTIPAMTPRGGIVDVENETKKMEDRERPRFHSYIIYQLGVNCHAPVGKRKLTHFFALDCAKSGSQNEPH